MDARPLVLDISSDEGGDDYDWISELLGEADDEKKEGDDDGSDDVLLVGEVVISPKLHQRTESSAVVAAKPVVKKDLDEDDCVVLDGDPDKPVATGGNAAGESDDLLIVGEKGQIACRDYPHSRHLCAAFPFSSTRHERHCHQCHCYVCDALAPCVHWGNGTSSIDHCHATDKDELWKLLRQNFKQGDKAPLPMLPQQANQCPPLTELQPNFVAQNQISRPTTIRACSTSTNIGIQNIANQGRSQQPVDALSKNKFQSHLDSQHLRNTRSSYLHMGRIFKRARLAGAALATNRSGYGSSNNNFAPHYCRNPSGVVASNDKNPPGWQGFTNRFTANPNLQNSGSSFANSVLSYHPNLGNVLANSVPSQPPVSFQPNTGSSFVNSVLSQQASSLLNMGCNLENSVPSQLQVSFHPPVVSSSVNQLPSRTQVYSQPIPAADGRGDGFQQVNETLCPLDHGFSGFDTSWISPTGQTNQQTLEDNSPVPSAGQTYNPPLVSGFDPQIPVNTNPGSLDSQFDSWLLDNQSSVGALEVSEPSGFNLYSPEPALVDAGFFFNI